jgi:hypothetical protein
VLARAWVLGFDAPQPATATATSNRRAILT